MFRFKFLLRAILVHLAHCISSDYLIHKLETSNSQWLHLVMVTLAKNWYWVGRSRARHTNLVRAKQVAPSEYSSESVRRAGAALLLSSLILARESSISVKILTGDVTHTYLNTYFKPSCVFHSLCLPLKWPRPRG